MYIPMYCNERNQKTEGRICRFSPTHLRPFKVQGGEGGLRGGKEPRHQLLQSRRQQEEQVHQGCSDQHTEGEIGWRGKIKFLRLEATSTYYFGRKFGHFKIIITQKASEA